jgi:flavin-binding protein dodecin
MTVAKVTEITATSDKGRVTGYRVRMRITFVLES